MEAFGRAAAVVDRVGEALGDDVVDVGVDVGLEREHVGRCEAGAAGKLLPDALVAVGVAPVEGDREGVSVGGDAGVGGGEDAAGGVEGLRELVVGDAAGPLVGGGVRSGGVSWDGAEGGGLGEAAANGDAAQGVVADRAMVVGVDEVLRGAAEGGERADEGGAAFGGVDGEKGGRDVCGVEEGPAEGDGAGLGGQKWGDDRCGNRAVLGEADVEGEVGVAADVDRLRAVEDGAPAAVGGLELLLRPGAAEVLDVEVLDVGAEVGEPPGDVGVVADDDEGGAGKGDAGDMEGGCGRGCGSFEAGLVPDAGHGVAEVHVVGEQRLARGSVRAGDDPLV